jgi:hypothetical protein
LILRNRHIPIDHPHFVDEPQFLQNQLDKKQIKRNEGHEATIRFLTNQYQQLETFLKELQEDDNLHV